MELGKTGAVCELQAGEWDALVERHPLATIYHSSAWTRTIEEAFGHIRGCFLGLRDESAKEVVSGIPVYSVTSWLLGNRLISIPFGTLCDPLLRDLQDMARLKPALEHQARVLSARRIRVKARTLMPGFEKLGFTPVRSLWHHYLPLTDKPEQILKRFSRTNVRQWIQRAEKAELRVNRCTGEEAISAFYPFFVNTRRRLGLPWLPYAFFKALNDNLGEARLSVFLAKAGDVPLAGVLTLHFKDMLILESLGESDAAHRTGAVQLINWTAIQWAFEHGCQCVSFGQTEKENEGLAHHKRGWGCVEETLTEYEHLPIGSFAFARIEPSATKRWVRLLLPRLPVSLGTAFSRFFYSHWG